jgi:hypothetical protein
MVETTEVVVSTIDTATTAAAAVEPPTTIFDSESPGESISRIQPIRTITPEEYGPVLGQCMMERGIDVIIGSDGGLHYAHIPSEQKKIVNEVSAECHALYPVDGKYSGGLEEEELTRLHAYYVDTLVPCLQGQGYSGFNPPSLTTYLETYGTEGGWHPYTDIIEIVDQLNPGAFTSLTQACPQSPGTDYLFGE